MSTQSILLDGQESLITIPLFYKLKENKYGVKNFKILKEKEAMDEKDSQQPDQPPTFETLVTKWRPQTWQMNNQLMKQSTSYNQASGSQEIDFQKYKDNIVLNCLVEWDMVDDKGQPIPVSEQTVNKLPAVIVNELIRQYDQAMLFDDEQQGK